MSQNDEAAIEAVRRKLQSICKFMESNRGGGNTTASVAGLQAVSTNGMLVMKDRHATRRARSTPGVRLGTLDDLLVDRVGTNGKAFPATATDYLPPYDFLQTVGFGPNDTNAWMTLANTWFNNTRSLADRGLQMALHEGVDMDNLRNLIHVCMGSFEPKHEHKVGGVAYMLSRWCEEYLLDGRPQVNPKWPGLIKDEVDGPHT